jgi:hypothetical protein
MVAWLIPWCRGVMNSDVLGWLRGDWTRHFYVYSISAKRFFSSKVKRWVAASFPICLTAFRTTSKMSRSTGDTVVAWCHGIILLRFRGPLRSFLRRSKRGLLRRAQQGFIQASKGTRRFIGHRQPSSAMRCCCLPCAS